MPAGADTGFRKEGGGGGVSPGNFFFFFRFFYRSSLALHRRSSTYTLLGRRLAIKHNNCLNMFSLRLCI